MVFEQCGAYMLFRYETFCCHDDELCPFIWVKFFPLFCVFVKHLKKKMKKWWRAAAFFWLCSSQLLVPAWLCSSQPTKQFTKYRMGLPSLLANLAMFRCLGRRVLLMSWVLPIHLRRNPPTCSKHSTIGWLCKAAVANKVEKEVAKQFSTKMVKENHHTI